VHNYTDFSHVKTKFNEMKQILFQDTKSSNQPIYEECCICLEPLIENLITSCCHHQFHKKCIKILRQRTNNCPLCRREIKF
jgi:hypothetical protein